MPLIAPGAQADLLTLDWETLSADLVDPATPPLSLVLARGRAGHVRALQVGGRDVVRDGRATGIDLPALERELLACLRAGWEERAGLRAAMPELAAAMARHYGGEPSCC
jgi:cytosine/adenosine deaminase-related metal-dependent hydrolase